MERLIETITRLDGKAYLFIIERDDGRCRFEGRVESFDEHFGLYWEPTDISGLYASADEAKRAAYRDVLWLKLSASNEDST